VSADVVLDASAAAKWVRNEPGSQEARAILERHMLGELHAWMPEQCAAELLAVVRRDKGPEAIARTWQLLQESGVTIVPLSFDLVAEAARQCELSGCSFYDALAPALSGLVDGTLVSADVRAHSAFPGVLLLG
jgi:predicted nucleic acid-binding protein